MFSLESCEHAALHVNPKLSSDAHCRSPQDVVKQGVIEVATRELYDIDGMRAPKKNGALDSRMVFLPHLERYWWTMKLI